MGEEKTVRDQQLPSYISAVSHSLQELEAEISLTKRCSGSLWEAQRGNVSH